MSGLFGGGREPAPPKFDEGAEAKIARQESKVEAQETQQKRTIQAGKRARRTGGRRLLMAQDVTAGDAGPGREVLSRTLGIGRNSR